MSARALSLSCALLLAGCQRSAAPSTPSAPEPASPPSLDAAAPSAALDATAAGPNFLQRLFDPYRPRANGADPWAMHAIPYRGDAGGSFQHVCPPNGRAHEAWGTVAYTDDSSICTAAVHAGRITFAQGGTVTVYLHAGRNGYVGSGANDVLTKSYQWFPGSFAFEATLAEDVFPPPRDR